MLRLCSGHALAGVRRAPPGSSVSSRNASESRAVGALRRAADMRGQADHMSTLKDVGACAMANSGWFSRILPDEVFSGVNGRTDILVAGLRRAGKIVGAIPPALQPRSLAPEPQCPVMFAGGILWEL